MVNPDVNNLPEGHPGVKAGHPGFKSPQLMKVDTLCVKLAMGKLFCSCGGKFEITTAVFHGINVTYEKPGIHWASNVDVIVEYIKSKLPKKEEAPPPPPPPAPATPTPTTSTKEGTGEEEEHEGANGGREEDG